MTPDIKLQDFYLKFISDAKNDSTEYKHKLFRYSLLRDECQKYIKEHLDVYNDIYNINLSNYSEWTNNVHNTSNSLYNKALRLYNENIDSEYKVQLFQLLKYCNSLRQVHECNKLIDLTSLRKNMTYSTYRAYIKSYYEKVHECVLLGMGYKYGYGIGVFCINRWKLNDKSVRKKQMIDYHKTNKRKKELIAQGIKLYNAEEAAWYKERNIPYDGVDPRVYKQNDHIYELTFIKSNIFSNKSLDFKHLEHIPPANRGKSYTDMADECKDMNDIVKYSVDIKYKLNMMLHKYPERYVTFIRTADENKYEHRTYSR